MQEIAEPPANEIEQMEENRRLSLQFFSNQGPQQLYIHKTVLNSQIRLMAEALGKNDTEFAARQVKDKGRPNRVLELLRGFRDEGMFQRFYRSLQHLQTSQEKWVELTPSERRASDILRTCMRAAGVCYELISSPWSKYPYQLFLLLEDKSHADIVMQTYREKPCLLDTWTRSFVEEVEAQFGAGALASDTVITILEEIAGMLIGNIFDVERTHTSHATRSKRRMTHRMPLSFLALFHQIEVSPSWFAQKPVRSAQAWWQGKQKPKFRKPRLRSISLCLAWS